MNKIAYVAGVLTLVTVLPGFLLAQEVSDSPYEEGPAAPAASTGDEAATNGECFPACRSGFTCHKGACINLCNPACDEGEKCTADGECVPKQHAVAPPTTSQPAPPKAAPANLSPQTGDETTSKGGAAGTPPPPPRGFYLDAGVSGAICLFPGGCDTGENGDGGIGLRLYLGGSVRQWLVLDGGISSTFLFLPDLSVPSDASDALNAQALDRKKTKLNSLNAVQVGARFYPLRHRYKVEPLAGIHLGYDVLIKVAEDYRQQIHGLGLDYTLGASFALSDRLSLALTYTQHHPIWFTDCQSNLEPRCAKYAGDRNQILFLFGAAATFFL